MEFRALKNLQSRTNLAKNQSSVVLESVATKGRTIDIEGQSMGVWILTDDMIKENGLKEVTDPILFKNGTDPTDGGLLSPLIFGETPKEKMRNHAFIDLKRRFFHPFVYEIIRKLSKNIDLIASGKGVWYIDDDGELIQIQEEDDKRYNEENTGLGWLVENFRKINFKDTGSAKRRNMLKMINGMKDNEIFISKWIVIPIFYRDITIKGKEISNPEINDYYTRLIKYTSSYDNEILSITKHLTLYNIQETLVIIRKLGQSLIEKKEGAFQKTILGKAPDYGGRGVISVPSLNGCDVPRDCIVDIEHSGIPLSYCIVMGYPFMIKWVMEFFEDQFRNKQSFPAYKRNEKTGEYELQYADIVDQTEIFTQNYIDEKMEMYKQTYGAERFETVKIKKKDGELVDMYFPGRWYGSNVSDPRANTIKNRPMTWTDIFYMAAVETLSDKYCYITRYPLEDYFGTFPSRVAVLSTIKTIPVNVNGKIYPHYPLIDLSLSKNAMATQFIDTFSISNLYLDAIGGD